MSALTKRATVYLDPVLHKVLRLKAVETEQSVSEIINEAIKNSFAEDQEDIAAFRERARDPLISFEDALKEIKRRGKI
jgi:hypothetical protein